MAIKKAAVNASILPGPNSALDGQAREAVQKYNEKHRSISLLEKHEKELTDKKKSAAAAAEGEFQFRSWDRERDLLNGGSMKDEQRKKMIESARTLDTRFSRSSGGRNFL